MKKKALAALLASALSLGLLAGCGGADNQPVETPTPDPVAPSTQLDAPPDTEQILYDINSYGIDVLTYNNAVGTSCEIVKRQSNPEDKEDLTYIRLLCENEGSRLEYQFMLYYTYYDVGGWILEDVVPEKPEEWTETYFDHEGNDLLDSVIWLDEFEIEDFQDDYGYFDGKYYDEVDGVHYIGLPYSYSEYTSNGHVIYDQNGKRLSSAIDADIRSVFVNKDGKARFALEDESDDYKVYLADQDGNRLSGNYDQLIGAYGSEKILVTADYGENDRYGAVDCDGNILLEMQYDSIDAVLNARGITPPYRKPVPEEDKVYIRYELYRVEEHNNILNEYFLEDGTPVELPEHDETIGDRSQGLILILNNGVGRYYDQYGRPRSPEFEVVQFLYSGHRDSCRLIAYEGRCGILPKYFILGEEAGRAVEFEWEH